MKKSTILSLTLCLVAGSFTWAQNRSVSPLVTLKESPLRGFISMVTPADRIEMVRKSAIIAIRADVGQPASEGEDWEDTKTWHEIVVDYGNEVKVYKTKQSLNHLKQLLSKD